MSSAAPPPAPPPADRSLSTISLATLWLGRFTGNWSLRFTYSFLPAVARGVGISLETAGLVVGLRELAGATGPFLARLVDRVDRRTAMAVTLVLLAAASTLAALGGLAAFAAGMVAAGLAKVAFDVTANAWIGDHVPFARRGKVTGAFETSWAAAFLVGVPVTAVLIDSWSWRAPFLAVSAMALLVALLLPGVLAPDRPTPAPRGSRHHLRPAALAFYLAVFLQSLGPQLAFASYGAWFEDAFGLDVEAVGAATIFFGLAELCASGGSAVVTDRLGKRRSMAAGLALALPALGALGTVGDREWLGVALLALAFLGFEFSLVSGLPLASELDPDARSRGVGTTYAAMTAARAVGAAGGIALFAAHGIAWTAAASASVTVLAILTIIVAVEEP